MHRTHGHANPAHLDPLKRAYERFPEIGGRAAFACPSGKVTFSRVKVRGPCASHGLRVQGQPSCARSPSMPLQPRGPHEPARLLTLGQKPRFVLLALTRFGLCFVTLFLEHIGRARLPEHIHPARPLCRMAHEPKARARRCRAIREAHRHLYPLPWQIMRPAGRHRERGQHGNSTSKGQSNNQGCPTGTSRRTRVGVLALPGVLPGVRQTPNPGGQSNNLPCSSM